MEEAKKHQSKKQIFQDLAAKTGGSLEKAVGFVAVIRKD